MPSLSHFSLPFWKLRHHSRLFHLLIVTITIITFYWSWWCFTHSPFSRPLSSSSVIMVQGYVANKFAYKQSRVAKPFNCVLVLLGNLALIHESCSPVFVLLSYCPFFWCRLWLLTSLCCDLGLPDNSVQVHEYYVSARSSSLAHELFMNTYIVIGYRLLNTHSLLFCRTQIK